MNIREDDVVMFANGNMETISNKNMWILETYYNDDLTCKWEREFDIIRVYRPELKVIYERGVDYDRDGKTAKRK